MVAANVIAIPTCLTLHHYFNAYLLKHYCKNNRLNVHQRPPLYYINGSDFISSYLSIELINAYFTSPNYGKIISPDGTNNTFPSQQAQPCFTLGAPATSPGHHLRRFGTPSPATPPTRNSPPCGGTSLFLLSRRRISPTTIIRPTATGSILPSSPPTRTRASVPRASVPRRRRPRNPRPTRLRRGRSYVLP